MMNSKFTIVEFNNGSRDQQALCKLLVKLDEHYIPPISTRVKLEEYSRKLLKNGRVFSAISSMNEYIGLLAIYVNDSIDCRAFISSIGVLPEYHGSGVSDALMLKAIDVSGECGMKSISLEVNIQNHRAIDFYGRYGFRKDEKNEDVLLMTKELPDLGKFHQPFVSICCLTYNHAPFIRDALDGFLAQKTAFPIEILIHDDASTDGTAGIIREYEKKYPDLIFPIYQTENQYSEGVKISFTYQFPRAHGKYIALCEGDDHWIDPHKLQKQVSFLEQNPGYSACFTDAALLNELDRNIYATYAASSLKGGDVSLEEILRVGGSIFPTASLVFRAGVLDQKVFTILLEDLAGDTALIIAAAMSGKVFYLDQKTVMYRIWKGGAYSGISNDPQMVSDWKLKRIKGYKKLYRVIGREWRRAVKHKISSESLYIILNSKQITRFYCIFDLTILDVTALIKEYVKLFIRIFVPGFKRSPRREG